MTIIIDIIEGFTILPDSYTSKSAVVISPAISGDDEVYISDDVSFVASGSVSAFGTAIEYTWILPDGSTFVGDTLNFHVPEDTKHYSEIGIKCFAKDTFGNESAQTLKLITAYDINMPVINNISWDDDNHVEDHSYILTIDATDPQSFDIVYEVVCNDDTVEIIQRDEGEEHIFDITYGEYTIDEDLIYTITVTNINDLFDNEDELIIVHDANPIINNISWDNNNHIENHSYILTIDATDPQGLDIIYSVGCDDGSVGIIQRSGVEDHIFDITYGEYANNVNLTYTITVTNSINSTIVETENIIVYGVEPAINTISWNDNNHLENHSYILTIDASDPNNQDLIYEVICDDGSVGVVQRSGAEDHIFDITYGEYDVNTNITYTITVTNENMLTDIEDEIIIVHDTNPVINNISWNPSSDQYENETYTMTITASDPQSQILTYSVVCTDENVDVDQRSAPNEHMFDITYGEYASDTSLTYTITITNEDTLTDVEDETITVHDANPTINTVSWNNSNHIENQAYTLTIDATDPQSLDLVYELTCSDLNVEIVQYSAPFENRFDITYGEYDEDTNITYTITVTNEDTLTDVEDEVITVHYIQEVPVINTISWDNNNHLENESYVMTIGAIDPNNQNITYGVVCDDGSVGVVQRTGVEDHIFDITYGEYTSDVNLTYTITVTNTDSLTDTEDELIIVYNTVGDRGIFGGGYFLTNTIEYITISSIGDTSDFGNLSIAKGYLSATSNGTNNRGIFGGGHDGTNYLNIIEYITISTIGNVINFGNLSSVKSALSATSNGTNDRGVFAGGDSNIGRSNVIEYITISTTGDVTDFGNLSVAKGYLSATSNGTNNRGIFGGGHDGSIRLNTIEYVTISTTGDVTDFGDLSVGNYKTSATSNGTNDRGVFAGGDSNIGRSNVIEYITISTTGDVTDFGNLSSVTSGLSATSNGTNERGVFAGGYNGSIRLNTIEYVTISTTGDVTDFGNLSVDKNSVAATSDA